MIRKYSWFLLWLAYDQKNWNSKEITCYFCFMIINDFQGSGHLNLTMDVVIDLFEQSQLERAMSLVIFANWK